MKNSMALFIFFAFDQKYPFWVNLIQKIKTVSLIWNNLALWIIRLRIQWCCTLFLFSTRNMLKSRIARGAYLHSAFIGNCPTLVICFSFIYQVDELFYLFLVLLSKMKTWVNLSSLVLIKGMREVGESKIFLCYPRSPGTFHQYFHQLGGVFRGRVALVSD